MSERVPGCPADVDPSLSAGDRVEQSPSFRQADPQAKGYLGWLAIKRTAEREQAARVAMPAGQLAVEATRTAERAQPTKPADRSGVRANGRSDR